MQQNKADKFNLTNFMKYKYIIFIDKVKKTIETKIRLKGHRNQNWPTLLTVAEDPGRPQGVLGVTLLHAYRTVKQVALRPLTVHLPQEVRTAARGRLLVRHPA